MPVIPAFPYIKSTKNNNTNQASKTYKTTTYIKIRYVNNSQKHTAYKNIF